MAQFFSSTKANQTAMKKNFPLHFTLENGTHVVVDHTADHKYEFTLKPEDGPENRFSYRDDKTFTEEMEEALNFDQLNALRRFWLELEKEELS
jgi:hypothetical protein